MERLQLWGEQIITETVEWHVQQARYRRNGYIIFGSVTELFLCFWWLQETKPSGDGAEKKDGEYIKLKVIGQVRK